MPRTTHHSARITVWAILLLAAEQTCPSSAAAVAAAASLQRQLSAFTAGDLLWRPKRFADPDDDAEADEPAPILKLPFTRRKARDAAPAGESLQPGGAAVPEDQRAPWNKNWRNSVAICATMRQENVTDVVEWLTYYQCAHSCSCASALVHTTATIAHPRRMQSRWWQRVGGV